YGRVGAGEPVEKERGAALACGGAASQDRQRPAQLPETQALDAAYPPLGRPRGGSRNYPRHAPHEPGQRPPWGAPGAVEESQRTQRPHVERRGAGGAETEMGENGERVGAAADRDESPSLGPDRLHERGS